ncbi:MAG TPA: 30S ribosomal protein S8 [Caldisericia bacterium]|nr:30S ribosomal protein S8 [Caldisericia bacterium]HPB34307.1 30S ribosomal protein S8 [Caldisericia bacterium]HQL66602.1 30S ribosomal protein S8 [Caldisericia bacterium]HQO99845.1 30S ribosomal protein S8 [Caldisericia bacterium]
MVVLLTDPIADLIARIKNANLVYKEDIEVPFSNMKKSITQILKEEGYIKDFEIIDKDEKKTIKIYLKFGKNKERAILGIERVSKPGRRVYVGKDEIPKVLNGIGMAIISTSKGVISDRSAKKLNQGGEVLLLIW